MAGKKKNISGFSVNLLDVLDNAIEVATIAASIEVEKNVWGFPINTEDMIELTVSALMDKLLTGNIAAETVDVLAIRAIAPNKDESPESLAERRRSFADPFRAKMRVAAKYNGKRKLNMAKTIDGLSGKFMVLGLPGSFKERTKDNAEGKAE